MSISSLIRRLKRSTLIVLIATSLAIVAAAAGAIKNFSAIVDWFSPPQPKVSFHYRTLEGHSVALFLQGKLPQDLKEQLGEKYFIVTDDAWKFGNNLVRKHGYRHTEESNISYQFHDMGRNIPDGKSSLENDLKASTLIPGTTWDEVFYEESVDSPFDDISNLRALNASLNALDDDAIDQLKDDGSIPASELTFTNWIDCKEFLKRSDEYLWEAADFYKDLVGKQCPDKFAISHTRHTVGCGHGWYTKVYPPRLKLKIVAIQNNDSEIIPLSSLKVRRTSTPHSQSTGLSTNDEIFEIDLNEVPLRPGETAYLATHYILTNEATEWGTEAPIIEPTNVGNNVLYGLHQVSIERNDLNDQHYEDDAASEADVADVADETDELEDFPPYVLSGNDFADWLRTSASNLPQRNQASEYSVGPAQELVSLTGPDFEIDSRTAPFQSSIISEYFDGGSCPRLFASYNGADKPKFLGKFLVDANTEGVDRTDLVNLTSWPASLKIEEWESETTRIKSVDIVCYREGVHSSRNLVSYKEWKEIRRGEFLEIPVPSAPHDHCDSLFAKIQGHYVVDSNIAAPSLNQRSRIEIAARTAGSYCPSPAPRRRPNRPGDQGPVNWVGERTTRLLQ